MAGWVKEKGKARDQILREEDIGVKEEISLSIDLISRLAWLLNRHQWRYYRLATSKSCNVKMVAMIVARAGIRRDF